MVRIRIKVRVRVISGKIYTIYVGEKTVNTRPYLGQESKEGAKKVRARVQKGGQKCQKSYTTNKAGKKDTV